MHIFTAGLKIVSTVSTILLWCFGCGISCGYD